MEQVNHFFPLPYLTIDNKYNIMTYSEELLELTNLEQNFIQLLDEASIEKVKRELIPKKRKNTFEVNLKHHAADHDPILCDLHVTWKHDLQAELLLQSKQEEVNRVSESLERLQKRLNDTNFELLEEKEKLQQANDLNNKLSAPFITISSEAVLVPLFGDLNESKMNAIKDHLVKQAQQIDVDDLLIDFTGVGQIEREGLSELKTIFESLTLMGLRIILIGLSPQHSRRMNDLDMNVKDLTFMNSLQKALTQIKV